MVVIVMSHRIVWYHFCFKNTTNKPLETKEKLKLKENYLPSIEKPDDSCPSKNSSIDVRRTGKSKTMVQESFNKRKSSFLVFKNADL